MKVDELLTAVTKNYGMWFTAVTNKLRELATSVHQHVNFKGNPHGTTKTDIGLGNLPNYPVATDEEASKGESNTTLMTPHSTQLQIQAQTVTDADIQELTKALTTAFKEATTEIEQA